MDGASPLTCLRAWLRTRASGLAILTLLAFATLLLSQPARGAAADWPTFGQNLSNTASTGTNQGKNVSSLQVKWTFTTGGDVSARAAVAGGVVYFPDWAGNLWAVNASDGTLKWGHQLSDYGLPTGTYARATPTVSSGTLYLGTQGAPLAFPPAGGNAYLLSINAATGALNWKTQLESSDPWAMISTAVSVYNGLVYAGVASNEELVAAFGGPCCFARGSVVAVDASTGAIMWKTRTTPPGYSGVSVWGSNPVVDPARGSLYVGTGNNFSHPIDPAYLGCIGSGGTPASCSSSDNHVDSILALDLVTGAIKWSTKLVTWNQTVPPYLPPVIDAALSRRSSSTVPPIPVLTTTSAPRQT
jgi:polyvinyl alcohol dehydrogenase (cytochrome)